MRSMPDTENPRSHIQPLPLPIPSHQELQITARNAKFHTCEVPTRKEVAMRRIMNVEIKWANAVIYKPYQPVGEVFLDNFERLGTGTNGTKQPGIFGRETLPFGAAHTSMAYTREYPPTPRGHIVLSASCTCHLLYFLCCLLYLDVVSSFLLTSSCLLVTSKYQLLTADYDFFFIFY